MANFKPSKLSFTTAGAGRPTVKSDLYDDVETAMGGGIFETVVSSNETAEALQKELRRAASQIKRDVTGSGGVENRPATVKTEIQSDGTGKFRVLFQVYAPVPKRVKKEAV